MNYRAQVQAVLKEFGLHNKFKLRLKDGCCNNVLSVTVLEWDKTQGKLCDDLRTALRQRIGADRLRVVLYVEGPDIVGWTRDSDGKESYIYV